MGIEIELKDYIDKAPETKTTIRWWNLGSRRYVFLKKQFQIKLLKSAIRKSGSQTALSKLIGKSVQQVGAYKKGRWSLTIETLKRICAAADFTPEEVEKRITCLGGVYSPKLPFRMHSVEGAILRGRLLSDGHNSKDREANPFYCSLDKAPHKTLLDCTSKVLGQFKGSYGVPRFVHQSKLGIYRTFFPPVVGDVLELSGVSRGNKSLMNPFVPKDILQGNSKIQKAYLQAVFDDEGSVGCYSRHRKAITLCRNSAAPIRDVPYGYGQMIGKKSLTPDLLKKTRPSNLLIGEQLMLRNLNIESKLIFKWIRKNKNYISSQYRLVISRRHNIELFRKRVGFSLNRKTEKLNALLNSYKTEHYWGSGYNKALLAARRLTNKKGSFKTTDMAKELGISNRVALRHIQRLRKRNDVFILKGWEYAVR